MKKFVLLSFLLFICPSLFAKEPILIGLDADMSVVAAEGGVAISRGAQIAIDEINATGGVLGRPLELKILDHRGNPDRGVANLKALVKKKNVVAVLGGVHTPVALHELPLIHQEKLVYLGPWAAGTGIVDNGFKPNYVFRLSVRDEHAATVLMRRAKQRGFKRVGLLLERTGWGRSNNAAMGDAAQELGLEVAGVEWFSWREPNMKQQINRLINNGAEAIFLVANAPEGVSVVKDLLLRPEEQRVPILSHWGIASGSFVEKAGLENIQKLDIEILQTFSLLTPANETKQRSVVSQYQQKYDSKATAATIPAAVGLIHAYDLVYLLREAIVRAGSIDRPAVRDAMENIIQFKGLSKNYYRPFTSVKHDALTLNDYHMARFGEKGFLVPADAP